MSNLNVVPGWGQVPQIEKNTPLKGGPGGELNAQAQELAARTEWLREHIVSVKDPSFAGGAKGDGSDATLAFGAAARAAPALNNIAGIEGSALPRALQCKVIVPAGTYLLTEEVDTGNREVTWVVDQGALILGFNFINGKILRPGARQNDAHHGTNDFACSMTIRSNVGLEEGAEVLGVGHPEQLATYTDRDSVSLYVENSSPPPLVNTNAATYTATSCSIGPQPAAVVRRYRRGMLIDTKHSPKWTGVIESWSEDGQWINVTAWYRAGEHGVPSTPTNGPGLAVNPFTKVWAHNANVFLTQDGWAKSAAGFELGVMNQRGDSDPNFAVEENRVWVFDAVNLGAYTCHAAFISRGSFRHGYLSMGQERGFTYQGKNGTPFTAIDNSMVPYFVVNNEGCLELGSTTTAAARYIDLKSSGNPVDFDGRLICTGGTSTEGQGDIGYRAATHTFDGHVTFNGLSIFKQGVEFKSTVTMSGVNASLEIGSMAEPNTPLMDFHSSGNVNDFDARIMAVGGAAASGQADLQVTAKSFSMVQPGTGFRVKEGANCKQGSVALVNGQAVVPNTTVTSQSRIFPASQADGGAPGFLRVSARVPGVSFTITSSSPTDSSLVAWEMFEPA